MNVQIEQNFLGEILVKEYVVLLELNLLDKGLMHGYLTSGYSNKHKVFIAKWRNKIVGWSIVPLERRKYEEVDIFVHKKYRRRGVGTKLFHFVEEKCGELRFNNHSEETSKFLRKLEKNAKLQVKS